MSSDSEQWNQRYKERTKLKGWVVDLHSYLEFTNKISKYVDVNLKTRDELVYLALGLAGEAGEVVDEIKKLTGHSNQDQSVRKKNIELELGDVFFHIIRLIDFFGLTPEQIIKSNQEKLQKRYYSGRIHSGHSS